jgi:hypothetical protein
MTPRNLAVPFTLLLLAVFVFQRFAGNAVSGQASSQTASPAQTASLPYPVPSSEAAVCKSLEEANARFGPLESQLSVATDSGDANAVRKQLLIDQAKVPIAKLFKARNQAILSVIGAQRLYVDKWVVKITKIDMNDEDFGDGIKRYITLSGEVPCNLTTTFSTNDMLATPEMLALVTNILEITLSCLQT